MPAFGVVAVALGLEENMGKRFLNMAGLPCNWALAGCKLGRLPRPPMVFVPANLIGGRQMW